MNPRTRETLEAEGYKVFEHAGDAVGMTEQEKLLMDMRIELAISVRKRREKLKLTRAELGLRIKATPLRVAKIERAARDVSFDQILNAYAALGGRVRLMELTADSENGAKLAKQTARKRVR